MKTKAAVVVLAMLLGAAPALADWPAPGQSAKWVQPPKVDGGWDVMSSYYLFLADDFLCTKTGAITDIHTWVSFKNDQVFQPSVVHLAIWSDDPAGNGGNPGEQPNNPFSHPLNMLWHGDQTSWVMRPWDSGPQGWFDPRQPGMAMPPPNHYDVYQMNFNIPEPLAFHQVEGNIYWLEFTIQTPHEVNIGWKESITHWNDDAVWRIVGEPWNELVDPITYQSMDLAFVITTIPEPATISLLALGVLALLGLRRRHS